MRIAADTNLLVRLFTADNPAQNQIATTKIRQAEAVIVTLPVFCELVWVLRRSYGFDASALSSVIHGLMDVANTEYEEAAVQAGLALLDAGGDFADGVIAFEGRRMGAEVFVSFDRDAVRLLEAQGQPAELLA